MKKALAFVQILPGRVKPSNKPISHLVVFSLCVSLIFFQRPIMRPTNAGGSDLPTPPSRPVKREREGIPVEEEERRQSETVREQEMCVRTPSDFHPK